MAKKVYLKDAESGEVFSVSSGFSWTSFFFLFLEPLARGDFRYFFGMFAVHLILGPLTFGAANIAAWLYQAFTYNKRRLRMTAKKRRVRPADGSAESAMAKAGLVAAGLGAGYFVHSRLVEKSQMSNVTAADNLGAAESAGETAGADVFGDWEL